MKKFLKSMVFGAVTVAIMGIGAGLVFGVFLLGTKLLGHYAPMLVIIMTAFALGTHHGWSELSSREKKGDQ